MSGRESQQVFVLSWRVVWRYAFFIYLWICWQFIQESVQLRIKFNYLWSWKDAWLLSYNVYLILQGGNYVHLLPIVLHWIYLIGMHINWLSNSIIIQLSIILLKIAWFTKFIFLLAHRPMLPCLPCFSDMIEIALFLVKGIKGLIDIFWMIESSRQLNLCPGVSFSIKFAA